MQNPVMTFTTKKRINIELFIDRMADLGQLDQECDEGSQTLALADPWIEYTVCLKYQTIQE